MTRACTYSVALTGVTGHVVQIEAEVTNGMPGMILTGLPDSALRETRDRVRAAVVNSGEPWPQRRLTVEMFPASLPKHGGRFDTAIAAAVLAAAELVPVTALHGKALIAELGLDGRLRPVNGVLPSVIAAQAAGLATVVVADENAAEATQVPGMTIVSAASLPMLIRLLCGDWSSPLDPAPGGEPDHGLDHVLRDRRTCGTSADLADVAGQARARKGLEICAAGGHHLSLLGPPGSGKTMLAERLPGILPKLDTDQALEVTSIHSVAGMLPPGVPLLMTPPFATPHHTASKAAITGGGTGSLRPGAASLAHRGILFLDDAPEFNRDVLDALWQPLESGEIVVARSGTTATLPARCTLVLAASPCPCARTDGPAEGCSCSPATRKRYLARLSGPLLDRIDVKVGLQPLSPREILDDRGIAEPSSAVAVRVAAARERATRRLAGTPWRLNGEVPGSELRRNWGLLAGALGILERALERGVISERGAISVGRVAWTIADLAGVDKPGRVECALALEFFLGGS
jgi:magnesium chelatase family protein